MSYELIFDKGSKVLLSNQIITIIIQMIRRHEKLSEEPESMEQPMISHHQQTKTPSTKVSKLDFDNYIFVKYSKIKSIFLVPITSIITCFLIWIPILKSDSFKKIMLFKEVPSLSGATHLFIKQNKNNSLVKLFQKEGLLVFQFKKAIYYLANQIPYRLRFRPEDSKYFSQDQKRFKEKGLIEAQQKESRRRFGRCQHTFQVPGIGLFLIDSLTGPFSLLQYFTCLVYVYEGFKLTASMMLGVSFITTLINYYLLRRSVLKIKESTQKYTNVQVLCNGAFVEKGSQQLVPGDILKPPKNMPCDALLIQGGVFVNEATLTGENLPIQKILIDNLNQVENQKHWLYQGSIVIEQKANPLALVIETGFNTRKGQSFRSMMDHDYEHPRFVRSGFSFMIELLIICCVIFSIMIPIMIYKKLQSVLIILRFLDMLAWAIPPTFPIFFNICYSFTLYRLQKRKIFATEPTKTVTAGKIKNIYFDKTGTLTLNRIQFTKVTIFQQDGKLKQLEVNSTPLEPGQLSTKIFSSCHSARVIDRQLMGDEVDMRMFEKSGYAFEVSDDPKIKSLYRCGNSCLEALRINQYESQNRSMSVLVRDSSTDQYYIFVKGAPQKLIEDCVNKIQDYHNIIFKMSLEGLRLIAYGYKKVDNYQDFIHKPIKQFQSGLKLIGLMGFSNELRQQSRDTISLLKQSGVNVAMITGDNIWTAIQTSTRTGIIEHHDEILVIEGNKQNKESTDSPKFTGLILRNKETKQMNQLQQVTISLDEFSDYKHSIAVDSNFLAQYPDLINSNIKVFARSKPQTKYHIINTIQTRLEQEWKNRPLFKRLFTRTPYAVAMVGDGANDVMAIKEADVGIGINDCDSSFASDYSIDKLTDVEFVLRNGKNTLSIVLDMFRYYGSISLLKYTSSCIMSVDRTNYNDFQFNYLNYLQTLEIVIFMSLTLPRREHTVYYPNDNLLSLQNHLIFHGMALLPTVGLILIFSITSHLPGYVLNPQQQYSNWIFKCMTNTVISLATQCFFVINAFIIYTSWPWKQQIWKNKILLGWLILAALALGIYLFITDKLDAFFGYVYIPQMAIFVTLSVIAGFTIVEYLWIRVIKCMRLENSQ